MASVNHITFYAEVGSRIRKARDANGLTQQALGSLVSLTRVSITNIEMGRQKLMLHTLVDIATALKVDPASLLPADRVVLQDTLEDLLRNAPQDEKEWIKSAIKPMKQKGKRA